MVYIISIDLERYTIILSTGDFDRFGIDVGHGKYVSRAEMTAVSFFPQCIRVPNMSAIYQCYSIILFYYLETVAILRKRVQ